MTKNVNMSFRVNKELRDAFKKVCVEEYGMGMSTALSMFMTSVVRKGKLPVDLLATATDRYEIIELDGPGTE